MENQRKKNVRILGGGIGALTTAYYLTSRADWHNSYDITVYQLGWRLGGKCASSRNVAMAQRIEEHGLHVWFGFYENAFRLLRECYAELNRPASGPLATIDEAFEPRDFVPIMENVHDTWSLWPISFPPRPGSPGEGDSEYTPWAVLCYVIEFAINSIDDWLDTLPANEHPRLERVEWLRDLLGTEPAAFAYKTTLHAALELMRRFGPKPAQLDRDIYLSHFLDIFRFFREWLGKKLAKLLEMDEELQRMWVFADLSLTVGIGILVDRLLDKGLESIDDEEFRHWLDRHGAMESTVNSSPVRALYDCCFAFENGDVERPNFAAGTALGCALRIGLMYRGHVLYEMRGGMGEVVVAPFYQVLRKRGVKFEFFQRVNKLELNEDKTRIAAIRMARQVTLKNDNYEPLIDVDGLPCWPSEPRYDQIVEADDLLEQKINLESHWSLWQDVEEYTLSVKGDDKIVLGISLGGLKSICADLCEHNADWCNLIEHLPSIQTQSVQLWLTRDLKELGWMSDHLEPDEEPPVPAMVAAPEPLNVWADMSHLITRERWPADDEPKSIQYFCGPLASNLIDASSSADHNVPKQAYKAVRATVEDWFDKYTRWIWPSALDGSDSRTFDWDLLYVTDRNLSGKKRLNSQWLRANVEPTDRYVLSPAKVNRFRLPSCHSGYKNLVLAGDWTRTAINAGCVEAAVMSGMEASRALWGVPENIVGEDFMQGDWVSPCKAPIKVAILGGGCGAISAAYWLSSTPALRNKYDITVYTQGWRLGGKGASGRNKDHHERIEEHGLHMMMGYYDTLFYTMRACYREMVHGGNDAFFTWIDAFEPQRQISLQVRWPPGSENQRWKSWDIQFPELPGTPGDSAPTAEPNSNYMNQAVHQVLDWLVLGAFSELLNLLDPLDFVRRSGKSFRDTVRGCVKSFDLPDPLGLLRGDRYESQRDARSKSVARKVTEWILDKLFADVLAEGVDYFVDHNRLTLITKIRNAQKIFKTFVAPNLKRAYGVPVIGFDCYRYHVFIDLGLAGLKGYLQDVLPLDEAGFQKINDQDFKDWLTLHGAEENSAKSPVIMCLYDLAFAYENGDSSSVDNGKAAAGAMLRLLIRAAFTYQDAPLWKMKAGMGDVIFTPLYRVLEQRGIRFEFFHRASNLHLSEDGKNIAEIDLRRQVRIKHDEVYQPLKRVRFQFPSDSRQCESRYWDCWPSAPLWDQIQGGEALSVHNFEDPWDIYHEESVTLKLGDDFHKVVLAVPPKVIEIIGKELVKPEEPNKRSRMAWHDMVTKMTAVPTQSVQIWFKEDLKGLGWTAGTTASSTYAHPLKCWGEMSQVLPAEPWPQGFQPNSCQYLCGLYSSSLPEPAPDENDPGYMKELAAMQKKAAARWLASETRALWPKVSHRTGGGLDPNRVADIFHRVNAAYSDQYVQSLPGSIQYRLEPGGSGFDNLYLSGDWTRSSINGGSAEAAFESGMKAAQAIRFRKGSDKMLPRYISRKGHGEISYEVPLKISGVTAFAFVLKVNADRLQDFVDTQLNSVSEGAVQYRALPFVIHSYLDAQHATSIAEPIGHVPDKESAFLVPLLEVQYDELIPSLKVWVPYLLIDRMSGMVTGREVWGYHKTLGTITMPKGPNGLAYFAANTVLFKTFSPATKGKFGRLMQVKSDRNLGNLTSDWKAMDDAFSQILGKLDNFGLGLVRNLIPSEVIDHLLIGKILPVVNLKQFRDSTDSTKACYQALVDSPIRLEKWSKGGWLPGEFDVEITTCDSHRIVEDLGLGELGPGGRTVIPSLFAFWSKIDFSTLKGRIIWQAD